MNWNWYTIALGTRLTRCDENRSRRGDVSLRRMINRDWGALP